eukprot:GHVH01015866.1.p1 GENE.GHVH01015866.1~~GHVH01015866.1.p1  ORF type:complete len:121 (-),score=20.16 GHVH01015866.1:60-422(-)
MNQQRSVASTSKHDTDHKLIACAVGTSIMCDQGNNYRDDVNQFDGTEACSPPENTMVGTTQANKGILEFLEFAVGMLIVFTIVDIILIICALMIYPPSLEIKYQKMKNRDGVKSSISFEI